MVMGSEHLSDWQLKQYETRAAAPTDLVEIDDHLHQCDSCYERLRAIAHPAPSFGFRTDELGDHRDGDPLYSYLESYVDGKLSGTELARIERHLENCESCAGEAEELLGIKSMIASQAEMSPSGPSRFARRPRLYMAESSRARKAAWVSAAIAAGAALLIGSYEAGSLRSRGLKAQVAAVEAENNRLRESIAEVEKRSAQQLEHLRQEHDELQRSYEASQRDLETLRNRPSPAGSNVSAGNRVTVEINDGQRLIALRRNGEIRGLEEMPQSLRELTRSALVTGRPLVLPQLKLSSERPALMGASSGEESFNLIGPLGTAVTSDRPEFKWHQMAGASVYQITLKDSSTNQQETAATGENRWTPSHPLVSGRLYYWQVKTEKEGREIVSPLPSQPTARFWVLSPKQQEHLEQLKRRYRDSHLVLGVAYANAGLVDEAIREFRILGVQNPGSEAVRRILSYLDTLRR